MLSQSFSTKQVSRHNNGVSPQQATGGDRFVDNNLLVVTKSKPNTQLRTHYRRYLLG